MEGGNGEEKKENFKREGGRGKNYLFIFFFFTFQNDENLFWVYQNGNFDFYREKGFHAREKIRKNDFAPSEKKKKKKKKILLRPPFRIQVQFTDGNRVGVGLLSRRKF